MYTYKRFRTSKAAVVMLMALALLAWGILGPTDTPLARGRATFVVELSLEDSGGNPIVFYDGESKWPNLDVMFRSVSRGGSHHHVQVGDRILDLIQISLSIKHACIVSAGMFLEDNEGTVYSGWTDVEQPKPPLPDVGDSFIVQIHKPVDVFKAKGEVLGTVRIEDAVYKRTK